MSIAVPARPRMIHATVIPFGVAPQRASGIERKIEHARYAKSNGPRLYAGGWAMARSSRSDKQLLRTTEIVVVVDLRPPESRHVGHAEASPAVDERLEGRLVV